MSPNLKALTLNPLNIVSIMNDKPTPETDAEAVFPSCNDSSDTSHPQGTHVATDFARRLERERDELQRAYDKAIRQMNQAIAKAEWLRTDAIAKLERERYEYKAALQSADNHNHEIATKLEIVTEQRDRLAEALRMYGLGYTEDDLNQLATTDSQMGEITPGQAQREIKRREAIQSLTQPMTDPANSYARLASSIDADTRRERAALCPSDSTTCSRCAELEKNFRAALRVIANLEETIDRLETTPAPKYVPRCTHCHHRHATETNGLCGVCSYGLANAKAMASADARPTTKKTTL